MEIIATRKVFTNKTTISEVFIDGSAERECFFLEDKDRGLSQEMDLEEIKKLKVYGETAIPKGRYEVVISYSERFKKKLPLLLNVKGYEGIRIHTGNYAEHTHGCLLPGKFSLTNKDAVTESTATFKALFDKIETALNKEKVFITIK